MLRRTFLKSMAIVPFVPKLTFGSELDGKTCLLVDQPRGAGKTQFCLDRIDQYLNGNSKTVYTTGWWPTLKPTIRRFHENYIYDSFLYDIGYARFKRGDATVTFMHMGYGDRIRGLRADNVIIDDLELCEQDIVDCCIAGFVAPSARPVENVKRRALGLKPLEERRNIILCGTDNGQFTKRIENFKKHGDQKCLFIGKDKNIQDYIGV